MARGCCGDAHPRLWLHLYFLLLLLPLSAGQERWQQQPHGAVGVAKDVCCWNNYGSQGRRVVCVWQQQHNQSVGEGPFYLNFSDSFSSSLLCPLSASPETWGRYNCTAEGDGEFTENDEYRVFLHATNNSTGKSLAYPVFTLYEPRLHIQYDAPTGLQSHINASKCRIQWEKLEAFFLEDWHWQLAFKAAREPWERAKTKSFISQESWVDIDGSELQQGVDYVARIRCKIPDENTNYRSHWSLWSAITHCHKQTQLDPGPWRALLASLPLCLGALLLLLFLTLRFVWRMEKGGAHTPTPAPFFQPLYASHNGDFKGWAGLTGKVVCLSSDTEEEEEEMATTAGSQAGKRHTMAVLSSRITFLASLLEAEAMPWEEGCHPVGAEPVALEAEQVKGKQSGFRWGEEPLVLPQGGSLLDPGGLTDTEGKGIPPSHPSFPVSGPCWEKEALFSCSNDYYCMWGGGGSSGPGALMCVSAGGPPVAEYGCCPGVAPTQCAPGQV